jgi:uncharacterized protein YlxP (DUF503 family)
MRVGTLRVRLLIRESRSLKDKRGIVKSIKDRLRNKFNISVAEIGSLENKQVAEIGAALVANDGRYLQSVLSKVCRFIRMNPFAELTDSEIEII